MTQRTEPYCPSQTWETLRPEAAGFDAAALAEAVAYAEANESPWPRSLYYPDGCYVGLVEWNERGLGATSSGGCGRGAARPA